MKVVLADFCPRPLSKPIPQDLLLKYTAKLMAMAGFPLAEVEKYGLSPRAIKQRQFNCITTDGQTNESVGLPAIFPDPVNSPQGATIDERMKHYAAGVRDFVGKCYDNATQPPDDIVHVSCTGYASPSVVQRYVSERKWFDTTVTHSYHMGCYGAFPAVRMATGFLVSSALSLAKPKRKVDLLHSEFVSQHLKIADASPGSIINMTLFADGFIQYSAYPESVFKEESVQKRGLRILASKENLIPDSISEMTWDLGPHQFDMYLSRDVPAKVRDTVLPFTTELCAQVGVDFSKEKDRMAFAIHPGGPKIIDYIKEALGLRSDQVRVSHEVIHDCGNMSSATVPHIWGRMLDDEEIAPGTKIVSMAFGPGLTAAGFLLEKI